MISFRLTTSFFIVFLNLFILHSFSQTDTIYKKKHYNHAEYYSDKKVQTLGNMKDSMKTGNWIYFKQNGKLLAQGSYLNGKKIGKWAYVDYKNKKHSHKWASDAQPIERNVFEGSQLILYDHLSTKNPAGSVSLNYKFGVLEYYILD
jgi:hypothetical protein